MAQRFWLYSVKCTPLSTTDEKFKWKDCMLLFCLDENSNTHVIQVQQYRTSILIEPERDDMLQLGGHVQDLALPLQVANCKSHISTWNATKLIGFTNSMSVPVLQVFLKNERDRKRVRNALKFQNDMHIGPVKIKQFLHSRRDVETQFLFDSGLQLNTWFEAHAWKDYQSAPMFDKGVRVHMANVGDLRLMKDQPSRTPSLNKMYIRVVAHSSTATTTNQFDPSSEIDADEVRCIGYSLSDANEKDAEPHIMNIGDFENSEKHLLQRFANIVQQSNVHALVFAADERCNPNSLVYLFHRAKRYGINLHFSKLPTLDLECEMKPCGDDGGEYLVFKHPGIERVDICAVLSKAMVNPNLDGFQLIDALRHPKLIRNKRPFTKMLHLNYHGLNSFSSADAIAADMSMQVTLLKAVEQDSDFVSTQLNISRICDLDLTSVCERGQQARVGNLWARAYHNAGIIINDEQVKDKYVVVEKLSCDSSYPDPPWLKNPSPAAMRGENRPGHIIKQALPPHLQHFLSFPHTNVFQVQEESKKDDVSEPKKDDVLEPTKDDVPEPENEEKNEFNDDEEIQDEQENDDAAILAARRKGWWSNRHKQDFVKQSKKRKPKASAESKKRFRGGLVLDPELGFYVLPEEAACTFDFGSLYPSILEGFVLCYMRVIYDRKWLSDPNLEVEYVPITPTECLVLAKRYRGPDDIFRPVQTITPQIVHDIVELRKGIRKKQGNFEEGSFEWNTLERAQLAAKVVQNSVYGYIGSDTSGMTCTALAAAVTQIGQWMNRNIRFMILFFGGFVYYGDTDSNMGRMWVPPHLKTEEEIFAFIYEQAFHIQSLGTKLFPAPNKLEFEAVKRKFLLLGKKTYAAIEWSSKPKGWTLPPNPKAAIKGMATKKRDKCQYAHKIGEALIKRLLDDNCSSVDEYARWYKEELDKIPKGVISTIEALNPFVITCALNSEYKKDTGVLALSLATMIAQETGARPRAGTRLAFVSAHFRDERLHADACVIPDVFLRRKDRIDIEYYLQKQIWNCVKQILCLPVHDALRERLDIITQRYISEWNNKRSGHRELTDFFKSTTTNCKRVKTTD